MGINYFSNKKILILIIIAKCIIAQGQLSFTELVENAEKSVISITTKDKNGNPLMPKNEKYARYKLQSDGTYALKWKTGNHCWRMWSSCVFTWDAKVVPCCFDKDALHQLGDLNKHDFNTIWHSKRYSGFRNTLFRNRNSIDICKNCSEGAKVWA